MTLYKIFGYAGALPFLALAFGLTVLPSGEARETLALIQLCYAGMIASFLAGVHWAHALPKDNPAQIFAAMQPTILSLFLITMALVTGEYGVIFILMALGFLGLYTLDRKLLDPSLLPEGYFDFRRRITTIVTAALIISAAAFWL